MLYKEHQSRIERIGPPIEGVTVSNEGLAFARAYLAAPHADLLGAYGYAEFFGNGFQLCDAQVFRAIAALIFKTDADLSHQDCHITWFTAWGDLVCWSERYDLDRVDLLRYEVRCLALAPNELGGPPMPPPCRKPDPETMAVPKSLQLLPSNKDATECWSWDEKPMFAEAARSNGPLGPGECLAFVPSFGMVGFNSRQRKVENVKKFPALEHFSMITQMDGFNLVRTVRGQTDMVRSIG